MSKTKIKSPISKGIAKTPVVMQLEALECGAASLAMVAAYYGKWVTLEQARSDCGVSRDGSSAVNIVKAARNYGFDVNKYKRNPESIRKKGVFPCIIHWNFDHFVVLNGFKGRYASINDPAKGAIWVDEEEFDKAFTGITINIVPGENYQPDGKRKSLLSSARNEMKKAGRGLAVMSAASVILALFAMIYPVMSGFFVDNLLNGHNSGLLLGFTAVLTGLALLQLAAAWIQTIYNLRVNGKLSVIGCSTYMWKVMQLPIEFFSLSHFAFIELKRSRICASSFCTSAKCSCEILSVSFLRAASSISCCIIFRDISSSSEGIESISVLISAHASSTRSIALSGRKRSVI